MFSFLFQAKFGFGWAHPLDFFSFRLISTHDYIMCYLILVVTLVSWLLFIIIKYFFWGSFNISTTYVGKFRYYLMGGFNNDLYL